MKTKISLAALAIALPLTMGAAAPSLADDNGYRSYRGDSYDNSDRDSYPQSDRNSDRDWSGDWGRGSFLSAQQIEYRLERRGYRNVHNISYSRSQGHYHAEARDRRGNLVRLSVDPRTAAVVQSEYLNYADRIMPFWRIERRLEARGYFDVQQLGAWGGNYRVEARDGRGRYVRMIVDGSTGEILRQRAADYGRRWSSREFGWN